MEPSTSNGSNVSPGTPNYGGMGVSPAAPSRTPSRVYGVMIGMLGIVVVGSLGVGLYATFVDPSIFQNAPPVATAPTSLADYPRFSEVASVESAYAAKAEYSPTLVPNPAQLIGRSLVYDEFTFERLQSEIALLKNLKAERTPALAAQVEREHADVYNLAIGDQTLRDIINPTRTPEAHALLEQILAEVEAYAIAESIRYDVPPPQYYDADIAPSATIAPSPQFPNVFAAKVYAAMFLLMYIDPLSREEYLASAELAVDRSETSGLYFEISSFAGAGLAEKYFAVVPYSEGYQTDFAPALDEFITVN